MEDNRPNINEISSRFNSIPKKISPVELPVKIKAQSRFEVKPISFKK